MVGVTPKACVRHLDARFRALGTPDRAAGMKAYMKSELRFHGVDQKTLRTEARAFCKAHPEMDRAALVADVDALFATDGFDLHSAAVAILERKWKLLEPRDAPWLVELARRAACWAHVDWISTKVIAPLLQDDRSLPRLVRQWARDDSFWVRRVALLAQLPALSRVGGDFALFAEIAAPMLEEREFFIRKAIGWVLREVSKKRPQLVRAFMRRHGQRCSGVTRREATKYLAS